MAEQNKKGMKDSPPGPPPGEGVVRSPSPEEQDPKTTGLSCGQIHATAAAKTAVAELERRWRPQESALGDEEIEGLQPVARWRQCKTAGAGYVETFPSASEQRRTVG